MADMNYTLRLVITLLFVGAVLFALIRLDGAGLIGQLDRNLDTWQTLGLCWSLYAVLLAIPFVPGVELGWLMMGLFGVPGILASWSGTVVGLGLGFLMGRGLGRSTVMTRLQRKREALQAMAPDSLNWGARALRRSLEWQLHHPYLFVALTLNLPGNVVLGGGGGIAWLSGLTPGVRLSLFLLTGTIATSVVPVLMLISFS